MVSADKSTSLSSSLMRRRSRLLGGDAGSVGQGERSAGYVGGVVSLAVVFAAAAATTLASLTAFVAAYVYIEARCSRSLLSRRERSLVPTIERQCSRAAAFFQAHRPIFNGLRSNSMALRHVWLGLPGGRFQSDGGLRIAAATAWLWSSSGALRAMWPKNLERRSVTILESLILTSLSDGCLICRMFYRKYFPGNVTWTIL